MLVFSAAPIDLKYGGCRWRLGDFHLAVQACGRCSVRVSSSSRTAWPRISYRLGSVRSTLPCVGLRDLSGYGLACRSFQSSVV